MGAKKMLAIAVLLLAVGAAIAYAFAYSSLPQEDNQSQKDYRPQHCSGDRCAENSIFSELPHYPQDFSDKWLAIYYGRLSNLSWIEEQYWKQPEFYADSFDTQWLEYYTNGNRRTNVAGSGPYPGDVVITGKPGEYSIVETFWHAGPANIKKQLFAFSYDFPESMNIRIGDIKVRQNATEASSCVSTNITPEWVLLDGTWPSIGYEWTQKIQANVSISEGCKPGWYGMEIIQAEVPKEVRENVEFEYGVTRIASILAGGSWQVFVHVEE